MRFAMMLAVCAACSEQGAHLTLHAPDGVAAMHYQVVLATPDVVPVIANQRVSPKQMATETVTYYLQRTTTGVGDMGGTADGFTMLVEPSPAIAETAFIPFVILYDDQQHVTGIGTFHSNAQSTEPAPIVIDRGEVVKFPIDVEAVTDVDDLRPTATSQALQVFCTRDSGRWQSGIAWRTKAGKELRLLLPDEEGATDATQRPLDLDCDGAIVAPDASSADCDDTRARFHAGANELCDGEDTNCDAVPFLVEPCQGSNLCTSGATTMGYTLCDDTTGTTSTTCSSDVTCLCTGGTGGNGTCAKCLVDFTHGSDAGKVQPCQPDIGSVSTQGVCENTTCTVSVVGTRNGWSASVGPDAQGPFGPITMGITDRFALKVKPPSSQIVGVANASVGAVDFAIVPANGMPATLLSVDLELASQQDACSGGGPFPMVCSP